MKKTIWAFLTIILISAGFFWAKTTKKENSKIEIVTSCYPVYTIVMNIVDGVENVNVTCLAGDQTGCLHDFQLKTDDMKKIEKSSAFVINGAGLETFLNKIVNKNPKLNVINSSENIKLLGNFHKSDCCCHEHNDEHKHEHDHEGACNPHIWLSVANYIKQTENIYIEIDKIDSKNHKKYEQNYKNYVQKLQDLQKEMHAELSTLKDKKIVTFHDAFPYFAQEFGFEIVYAVDNEHEETLNTKKTAEILRIIEGLKADAYFVRANNTEDTDFLKFLPEDKKAKVCPINIVTNDENNKRFDKNVYINIMKMNMLNIKKTLENNNE